MIDGRCPLVPFAPPTPPVSVPTAWRIAAAIWAPCTGPAWMIWFSRFLSRPSFLSRWMSWPKLRIAFSCDFSPDKIPAPVSGDVEEAFCTTASPVREAELVSDCFKFWSYVLAALIWAAIRFRSSASFCSFALSALTYFTREESCPADSAPAWNAFLMPLRMFVMVAWTLDWLAVRPLIRPWMVSIPYLWNTVDGEWMPSRCSTVPPRDDTMWAAADATEPTIDSMPLMKPWTTLTPAPRISPCDDATLDATPWPRFVAAELAFPCPEVMPDANPLLAFVPAV